MRKPPLEPTSNAFGQARSDPIKMQTRWRDPESERQIEWRGYHGSVATTGKLLP
jgi:hypothetical protein